MKLLLICLLTLLTSVVFAQGKPEKLMIKNEAHYGVRRIPGYDIIGTYKYDSADSHPIMQLNADGTGIFEKHDKIPIKIKWWIWSESTGAVKTVKGEAGQQHTIIVQYLEPQYTSIRGTQTVTTPANEYDMMMLTIRYDDKKMYILGERVKPY
jgi:hypothetical protein